MAREIQKLQGQSPDKRRNLLVGFLAALFLFLAGLVLWSGRGGEPDERGGPIPSPVAPLGPAGQSD